MPALPGISNFVYHTKLANNPIHKVPKTEHLVAETKFNEKPWQNGGGRVLTEHLISWKNLSERAEP